MAEANMEMGLTTDLPLSSRRVRITTDGPLSLGTVNVVSKPENNLSTAKIRITHKLFRQWLQLSQEGVLQIIRVPEAFTTVSKSETHNLILDHFLRPHTSCQLVEVMFSRFSLCRPYREAFAACIASKLAEIAQLAPQRGDIEFEFEISCESYQSIYFDGEGEITVSDDASLDSMDEVQMLKMNSFQSSEFRDSMCVVCQEDFSAGEEILEMPCSHIFHGNCLLEWLKEQHICPLCRFELPEQQQHIVVDV